ncbi:hypothetical protein PQI23_08465 [Leucobacter sp. USCH14]|uniref:hypothetical protein n=1 Tax=Leucobacter sp. USCH14 TaxID=3024838 RepID=UPI0030A2961D
MVLKYTSKRPDEELDGLQDLEDHFTTGSPDDVVVVAVISRHGIAKTDPSNEWQATVRVKHIEQVEGEDEKVVRTLLNEAYGKRTGNTPLPIEELPADGQLPIDGEAADQ